MKKISSWKERKKKKATTKYLNTGAQEDRSFNEQHLWNTHPCFLNLM